MNLPNKLTILRMLLIPFFVIAMTWKSLPYHYFIGLALFVIASLTDLFDGIIARRNNLITDFGKFMDPLADKLLVTAAMVCFVELDMIVSWVVILILAREFLVTSLRTLAAGKGIVIAADKWGKYKTVSQMIWVILGLVLLAIQDLIMPGQAVTAEVYQHGVIGTVILAGFTIFAMLTMVVVLLTLISGFNYMWKNRSVFSDM
ncbi:MAG: CDP-diacylglycerol--glycerol-3-phosphate 3-phosphatidyltransferase [Oscillospiraceae bacterium]|nr:CDP-diacylglycerol--glycerol-3-phosphate 3-phosphatidyltransferase [Oscillospiraceae bacterium]